MAAPADVTGGCGRAGEGRVGGRRKRLERAGPFTAHRSRACGVSPTSLSPDLPWPPLPPSALVPLSSPTTPGRRFAPHSSGWSQRPSRPPTGPVRSQGGPRSARSCALSTPDTAVSGGSACLCGRDPARTPGCPRPAGRTLLAAGGVPEGVLSAGTPGP